MEERREYVIRPTAPQATEQYSDIALTGLFNAHMAQVNSERQAIWQRYNVMLIANAVIFGFLSGGTRTIVEVVFGATFGMFLCSAWWVISASGWKFFSMEMDAALRFFWSQLDRAANPFEVAMAYEQGKSGGVIYKAAIAVIMLFMAWYGLILLKYLFWG